jgi:hypothetical protein
LIGWKLPGDSNFKQSVMKNLLIVTIIFISTSYLVYGQQPLDTLYLKNGSIVYGVLKVNTDNQYSIRTTDGREFLFSADEVESFVSRELHINDKKKKTKPKRIRYTVQTGIMYAPSEKSYLDNFLCHEDSHTSFSLTFMVNYTFCKVHTISAGIGLESYDVLMAPLFAKYRLNFTDKGFSPFLYIEGGGLLPVKPKDGADKVITYDFEPLWTYGWISGAGMGFSIPAGKSEFHVQAGYRFAHTSYEDKYSYGHYQTHEFVNDFGMFDITLGFKF